MKSAINTVKELQIPLFEELFDIQFVMALGLAVAFCWISHIGEKRQLSHFLSLGKRQESLAVWLRYNFFMTQNICTASEK